MTPDNFTEAARAEAERRHPAPEIETGAQLGYTQTEIREVVRRTFTNAAEWARDYLAAQEPTDAECTAVLNAVTTPLGEEPKDEEWFPAAIQRCREVMMSARRDEEKRDG